MSLEAIAAMLGHRSLDMTLRYAKIASRTVADEYFAVTEKVEALYGQDPRAARRRDRPEHGPAAPRAPPHARQRLVHPPARAGLRVRVHLRDLHLLPDQHRVPPHPAAQRDDAIAKHQDHREQLFTSLLARLDQDAS